MHSVPFSHRSGAASSRDLAAVVLCDGGLGGAGDRGGRERRVRIKPEQHKRVYLEWMREIRPWCVSRQLWWGHRLPVWYGPEGEEIVAESAELARAAASERGIDPDSLTRRSDVLDTWFSSALWPFATLGWPDPHSPHLRAFYPTRVLSTARDILFLWVARMVMMGIEFAGESLSKRQRALRDPGARRPPDVEVARQRESIRSTRSRIHGADALRFGLLAMSSSQDVRFSPAKVQQERDLANKAWNASRLVLLNVADVAPAPPGADAPVEDRWIAIAARAHDRFGQREHRLLRLRPRGARPSTRSSGQSFAIGISEDRQAAPLRRRRGGLGDAALHSWSGCSRSPIR